MDEPLTAKRYQEEIESLADAAIGDGVLSELDLLCSGGSVWGTGLGEDVLDALADMNLGDHQFVIYPHIAQRVILISANRDAVFETGEEPFSDTNSWSDVHTRGAYWALEADVRHHISTIVPDDFDVAYDPEMVVWLRERYALYEEFKTGSGATLLILEITGHSEGTRQVALLYELDDEAEFDIVCFDTDQALGLASALGLEPKL